MAKPVDLTPKLSKSIPPAESELQVPPGVELLGQRVGGLSAFSNVFKRGYGSQVFGSDSNGIWLGAADFVDARYSVDMNGNVIARDSEGRQTFGLDNTDGADIKLYATDGKVAIFIGEI